MNEIKKSNTGIFPAIIGMLLGVVALFGGMAVFIICVGWASFEGGLLGAIILGTLWTILSLFCLVLSIIGKGKMVKNGKKPTLGTVGIVIGVLALILSIAILIGSYMANSAL